MTLGHRLVAFLSLALISCGDQSPDSGSRSSTQSQGVKFQEPIVPRPSNPTGSTNPDKAGQDETGQPVLSPDSEDTQIDLAAAAKQVQTTLENDNPSFDGTGKILVKDGRLVLNLSNSSVKNLSAIQGMPVGEVKLSHTEVVDLSALVGTGVRNLYIDNSSVSDLEQLKGLENLSRLVFTPEYIESGIDVVRNMPSIAEIGKDDNNRTSPEYFWIMYDKEFGNN